MIAMMHVLMEKKTFGVFFSSLETFPIPMALTFVIGSRQEIFGRLCDYLLNVYGTYYKDVGDCLSFADDDVKHFKFESHNATPSNPIFHCLEKQILNDSTKELDNYRTFHILSRTFNTY